MHQPTLQNKQRNRNPKGSAGFTLVEVVIAGAILIAAMNAVAQISASALAGSKTLSSRASIEAAVNNNIQLLQQADSYLTYERVQDANDLELACNDPTTYLIDQLEQQVPEADLKEHLMDILNVSDLNELNFDRSMQAIDIGETQDVVQVTYEFQGPDTGLDKEYRTIELNPNFSAKCYTTT